MTDDENLAFITAVMAASKEAAGLPPDWGTTPAPSSAEAELEDAPRPPRLRGGMTTAELLPYGEVVLGPGGQEAVLERLTCPPVQTPGGGITACDPVSLEWQRPLEVDLRGAAQPVEVAALRWTTPRGDLLQAAVAVIGDLSAVTSWIEFPVPGTRLSIDKGCGAFIARNQVGVVAGLVEDVLSTVSDAGLVPVEVDGTVVGALFGSGDGPGGYELMLGRGSGAVPVALLVDLRVLPRDGVAP
jgi:hypothetical protein